MGIAARNALRNEGLLIDPDEARVLVLALDMMLERPIDCSGYVTTLREKLRTAADGTA